MSVGDNVVIVTKAAIASWDGTDSYGTSRSIFLREEQLTVNEELIQATQSANAKTLAVFARPIHAQLQFTMEDRDPYVRQDILGAVISTGGTYAYLEDYRPRNLGYFAFVAELASDTDGVQHLFIPKMKVTQYSKGTSRGSFGSYDITANGISQRESGDGYVFVYHYGASRALSFPPTE